MIYKVSKIIFICVLNFKGFDSFFLRNDSTRSTIVTVGFMTYVNQNTILWFSNEPFL